MTKIFILIMGLLTLQNTFATTNIDTSAVTQSDNSTKTQKIIGISMMVGGGALMVMGVVNQPAPSTDASGNQRVPESTSSILLLGAGAISSLIGYLLLIH